jgi:hypothetical protein
MKNNYVQQPVILWKMIQNFNPKHMHIFTIYWYTNILQN